MRYSGRKCGYTRTCHGPPAGKSSNECISMRLSGHSGQGSARTFSRSGCPATTQLRVIGSLRSSISPQQQNQTRHLITWQVRGQKITQIGGVLIWPLLLICIIVGTACPRLEAPIVEHAKTRSVGGLKYIVVSKLAIDIKKRFPRGSHSIQVYLVKSSGDRNQSQLSVRENNAVAWSSLQGVIVWLKRAVFQNNIPRIFASKVASRSLPRICNQRGDAKGVRRFEFWLNNRRGTDPSPLVNQKVGMGISPLSVCNRSVSDGSNSTYRSYPIKPARDYNLSFFVFFVLGVLILVVGGFLNSYGIDRRPFRALMTGWFLTVIGRFLIYMLLLPILAQVFPPS